MARHEMYGVIVIGQFEGMRQRVLSAAEEVLAQVPYASDEAVIATVAYRTRVPRPKVRAIILTERERLTPPSQGLVNDSTEPHPVWARLGGLLRDPAVDSVNFRAQGRAVEVLWRFHFVRPGSSVEIWASTTTLLQPVWDRLWRGASVLGRGGRFPFEPAGASFPADAPALLVWTLRDPEQAVDFALSSAQALRIPSEEWTASATFSPAIEANRRREFEALILKLTAGKRALGQRKEGWAREHHCAHCGQPLTHPASIRRGVGPECYRHYRADVLVAAERWTPRQWREIGVQPLHWLDSVLTDASYAE